MGLSIDISKLSSNQTIQVVLSSLFIAGITLGTVFLKENKTRDAVLDVRERVIGIEVGQEYIKGEIVEIRGSQKALQEGYGTLTGKIERNTDAIVAYREGTKAWIGEQSEETREQLKLYIFDLLLREYDVKKNKTLEPTVCIDGSTHMSSNPR